MRLLFCLTVSHLVEFCLCFQQQDETSQRHQENLQQIREKAFEMSILKHSTEEHNEAPNVVPYDHKKLCTICNVLVSVVAVTGC